jgi:hydrogenase maturation protease
MNVAVIGLGNVLLSDDGFGPFVIELLRARHQVPPEVELLDLGTPGLGLVTYLHERDAVVFVDTVAGPGVPGDVVVWNGTDLAQMPTAPRVSPHDPALAEALSIARVAGRGPRDTSLVGVVPGSLALGTELTGPVRRAADTATDIVRRRLEDFGFVLPPGDTAQVASGWWWRA